MANFSKYYLVVNGRVKDRVVTDTTNREWVLVELIKMANGLPFKISVVENNTPKYVLDSYKDRKFIKFLYEKNERS